MINAGWFRTSLVDITATVVVPLVAAAVVAVLSRWDLMVRFRAESFSRWSALRFLRARAPSLDHILTSLDSSLSNRQNWTVETVAFLAPLLGGIILGVYTHFSFGSLDTTLLIGLISATALSNVIRIVAHRVEPSIPARGSGTRSEWARCSLGYRVVRGCALFQGVLSIWVGFSFASAVATHGLGALSSSIFPDVEFLVLFAFNSYNVLIGYIVESRFLEESAFHKLLSAGGAPIPIDLAVDLGGESNPVGVRGSLTSIGRKATVVREDGYEEEIPWTSIVRIATKRVTREATGEPQET